MAGTRLGHFFGSQTKQKILLRGGSGVALWPWPGPDQGSSLKIDKARPCSSTLPCSAMLALDYWDMVKGWPAMPMRIK